MTVWLETLGLSVAGRANLAKRCSALQDLLDAILTQREHAFGQSLLLKFVDTRPGLDQAPPSFNVTSIGAYPSPVSSTPSSSRMA